MKNFKDFVENYGNINEANFVENYVKDHEKFGEDTKDIYSDIFSEIAGERVDFGDFENSLVEANIIDDMSSKINSDISKINAGKDLSDSINGSNKALLGNMIQYGNIFGKNSEANAKAADAFGKKLGAQMFGGDITAPKFVSDSMKRNAVDPMKDFQSISDKTVYFNGSAPDSALKIAKDADSMNPAGNAGIIDKIKGFFSSSFSKIKEFFTVGKGKSVGDILGRGLKWMTDPANTKTIIGSVGGIIALGLVIRALKKRNQLKKYDQLNRIYNQQKLAISECEAGNFDSMMGNVIAESMGNPNMMRIIEDTFGVDYSLICEEFGREDDDAAEEEGCQDNEKENTEEEIDESSKEQSSYFKY